MIIVETLDSKVTKNKETLDGIILSINSAKEELGGIKEIASAKQAELNDVLTRIDFAEKHLEYVIESNESSLLIKSDEVTKITSQVEDLTNTRDLLQAEVDKLQVVLETAKSEIDVKIKEYELTESKNLVILKSDYKTLEAKKKELNDFVQVLSIDATSNKIALESLQQEVDEIDTILKSKYQENSELNSEKETVGDSILKLRNEIEVKTKSLDEINKIIEDTNSALINLSEQKETLLKEVNSLTKEKEDFVSAKFAFAKEKEIIFLKENFIKDKYFQAGISY